MSDKLLKIYDDMHNFNISLDDLNSKNGLVQNQIKKRKGDEHGGHLDTKRELFEAPPVHLRIFEEEVDDTQSSKITDRQMRGSLVN